MLNSETPTNDPIANYKNELKKEMEEFQSEDSYRGDEDEIEEQEEEEIEKSEYSVEQEEKIKSKKNMPSEGISFKEYEQRVNAKSKEKVKQVVKIKPRIVKSAVIPRSVKKDGKVVKKAELVAKKPSQINFRKVEERAKGKFSEKRLGDENYNSLTYSVIKKMKSCEEKKKPSFILKSRFCI